MTSNKKASRIAAFWYLLVAIFGSFYRAIVDPRVYVSGDAVTTVTNVLAQERLFRLGVLSTIIMIICFLCLANAFYKLFESVDKDLARLMVIFIVASVPVPYLHMLKFAPILLSGKAATFAAFEPTQLQALAMVFLDMDKLVGNSAYIFYGLWMLPLGLLVGKSGSGFITKALGLLLMVGCFGYLFQFLTVFMALNNEAIASLWMDITIVAEILCIVWLLIKGPKAQKPAAIIAS